MHSHQISRVWLKKWARHAHLKFQKLLAGNPNPSHQQPSNFVQSGFPQRLTTGENLVLISLTISEIYKIENFSSSKCPQLGIKIVFENYFYTQLGVNCKDKIFNFEFLKSGLRYQHQIFTSCQPLSKPALCKKSRSQVLKILISRQKCTKHQMGVAGPIFEPHPPNLVRIHFSLSCKYAEIFVRLSQMV